MKARDYFAGVALKAFIDANTKLNHEAPNPSDYEGFAHDAYELADAMMKERSRDRRRISGFAPERKTGGDDMLPWDGGETSGYVL